MKRILFVDDEAQLLDGLRMRLHRLRTKWDMEFVDTGRRALEAMERHPFDVIVTDQRMPEMDGATLLQQVLKRWPQTVRIVLSGYAELDQTVRLVPVAHQYICKPCDAKIVENVIERCLDLQRLLEKPELRNVVGRLGSLPAAPTTYLRLQAAMASETTTVGDIARHISSDTLITAKVLQTVNSGFFRLPKRISSVEQAVGYLGLSTVRNLVVSAEVFTRWPVDNRERSPRLETLQEHASKVAALVHALTSRTQIGDDAMLAALLHDIGYWVLIKERSDDLAEAQRISKLEAIPMNLAEQLVLGATHAEVGAYLLGIWGFPMPIVEAVAHHHSPEQVPQTEFDALAALCIAHAVAEPCEAQAFDGLTVPHSDVRAEYLERVHAPFTWDEAKARAAEHAEGVDP
jgi:HD-like signal output (HDOD) protein